MDSEAFPTGESCSSVRLIQGNNRMNVLPVSTEGPAKLHLPDCPAYLAANILLGSAEKRAKFSTLTQKCYFCQHSFIRILYVTRCVSLSCFGKISYEPPLEALMLLANKPD